MRIALADSFHIHDRNFPSFFNFLERDEHEVSVLLERGTDGFELITCTGDYSNIEDKVSPVLARALRSWAAEFAAMEADALYDAKIGHLRIWPLCRSELLAFLLTRNNWQTEVWRKDDREIFDKAYAEDRQTLALNMGVAAFWLNHWMHGRKALFKQHACCVFSGSMTYTCTLLELLRRSPTRAFVMESTFTGNDYLFEEAYHPVANNLGVQFANLRRQRRQPEIEEPGQYDREVIKARNKVFDARNKNVTQPPAQALPAFPESRPQVLIAGQVCNDFSLIEDGFPYVSSIPVYRALILALLEQTDCNIIFKAHPWEHKKVHLKGAKTFDALARFVAELPAEQRARILLVEDVNLQALIQNSNHFITLCSQAGIEAALYGGLRPVVLGRAFYSGAGFTSDCPDIDSVVAAVQAGNGLLGLEGYKAFNRFLVDMLQHGTISVHPSGVSKLALKFAHRTPIVQKTPLQNELSLDATALELRKDASEWSSVLRQKPEVPNEQALRDIDGDLAFRISDLPGQIDVGQDTLRLPIEILNRARHALPSQFDGKQGVLSYHIFDTEGARYIWNGEKTKLLADIHDRYNGRFDMLPPQEPGLYTLRPALLYPGLCWLEGSESWEFRVA
ncbi:MAG: hypothetical protein AAF408_02395 [Pseudomonadota bacterium]